MVRKGYKQSKEHTDKISKARTGFRHTLKAKTAIGLAHRGRPSGRKGKPVSEYTRNKISISLKGRKRTIESRLKQSKNVKRGAESRFWKGGITSINRKIRTSFEYRLWRKAVYERDNWTCVWCGQQGGELNADHIKSFSEYPALRFSIDNGRTLCHSCHKKTDNYGQKAKGLRF